MQTIRTRLAMMVLATTCVVSPAGACADVDQFQIEGIQSSEAIFVGEPDTYERLHGGESLNLAF